MEILEIARELTTSGPVTYTLTAGLTSPETGDSALGPLTFMVVPEN